MILVRCANAKDADCSGHESGGFIEQSNAVLISRDEIAVILCCTCYVKVSDVVGEAERVLAPASTPVLRRSMSNDDIIRRLVGEE